MMKHILLVLISLVWVPLSFSHQSCGKIEYGSKKAPIEIIEYASPTCTVCAEFTKITFPKIHKKYIQSGKVRLTVINLPYNAIDLKACVLAQKSPNPRKFNKLIYTHQEKWLFAKDPMKKLLALMIENGMSPQKAKEALNDQHTENLLISQRLSEEKKQDIDLIPIFIVGQKKILGLMPWNELQEVIEKALKHVKKGNSLKTFGQKQCQKQKISKKPTRN